jgi:hypothetical protein
MPWQDLLVEGRFAFHSVESVGQVPAQLLVIGYQSRFHYIVFFNDFIRKSQKQRFANISLLAV